MAVNNNKKVKTTAKYHRSLNFMGQKVVEMSLFTYLCTLKTPITSIWQL